MIVFDLHCAHGHRFEGWFGSSSDYEDQRERGLVSCPECGSAEIGKAPMAPAVPAKGNTDRAAPAPVPAQADTQPVSNTPMPAEVQQALQKLAQAQAKALKNSKWVGKDFAEQSREMHYGERDEAAIHGQASLEDAKALVDEGVPVAPLPFPIAPPEDLN
ncbi:DUF1178 family protein [uncultured Erythrobacter sp.]|uniref:DUF1178 family protein n=1 Tax=uncultured Erythrobacter sp. TaxID=263913 RepID=UPI00261D9CF8|nr:DUF1178 family protein [uncultured Erythrobacter sp.]